MSILDQIEKEISRAIFEEGKHIEEICLGKMELRKLIEELIKLEGSGVSAEDFDDSDIFIDFYQDTKIKIIPTDEDSELKYIYKERLLN